LFNIIINNDIIAPPTQQVTNMNKYTNSV
jgi:hypothetical protein